MPNPIAYAMLLAWPLVAWAIYTRLPAAQALIWAILGAYLILPPAQAAFDLPVIPALDKVSISNLAALVFTLFLLRARVEVLPRNPVARLLLALFIASPFATSVTNPDAIPIRAGDVPPLSAYDAISYVTDQVIAMIPFVLARQFLRTEAGLRLLVQALVAAGLAYSLPMLVEARFSPQINVWVYGFFQHDFSQMMRGNGFRPIVFLPHGLWMAFLAMAWAVAAVLLAREAPPEARPWRIGVALYLLALLVLTRSLGPTVYAAGLVPLVLLAPRRWQVLVAAALAVVVITYPLLRGANLVPLDDILAMARGISAERAASLDYRITNEEVLLARAMEKPWFGWGGYGRSLILDPVTGRILSVPDGGWIIVLGTYGWLGYAAQYGLLTLPLLLLGREALLSRAAVLTPCACGIALIYAANLVDLLPNDTLVPLTWLMAGALIGFAEDLAAQRRARAGEARRAALPPGRRTVL